MPSFSGLNIAKKDLDETLGFFYAIDPKQFKRKIATAYNVSIDKQSDVREFAEDVKKGRHEFDIDKFMKSFHVTPRQIAKSQTKLY